MHPRGVGSVTNQREIFLSMDSDETYDNVVFMTIYLQKSVLVSYIEFFQQNYLLISHTSFTQIFAITCSLFLITV